MNESLKILFLWHHHQPYYKADGTFLMPWVRMHGVKDYWDMVRILDDYPGIKQTFNFAPSLLEQLAGYLSGETADEAFLLSARDPAAFSDAEKITALKTFFLANTERMIKRYQRYAELFEKRGKVSTERDLHSAAQRFTAQDFRDLQVWWNLAWVGEYSRFDPPFKYYLDKQKDFTEEEKKRLLSAHLTIMAKIVPHHIDAIKRGQIEISVSPFYHPILPLLCDTDIAISANAYAKLPRSRFRHAEDAEKQIRSALDYGRTVFGTRPAGMWPSEGSVSDATLKLLPAYNVKWVATDEAILRKSLIRAGKKLSDNFVEKYFAYSYTGGTKPVKMFFRDHSLSDKIGFVYSQWTPDDAARDFVSSLLGIRDNIIRSYGEAGLDNAVVPVILDGENAWEFYQSDGKDFLRTLYYSLENETRLRTVLPSEIRVRKEDSIRHIEPGSWINGNFDIWIGHPEDNKAWDFLYEARRTFEKESKRLSSKQSARAFKEIMICEGSDWCWWYGDEHKSPQAAEFDKLFRFHVKEAYRAMGVVPPASLDEPIKRKSGRPSYRQPTRMISPLTGTSSSRDAWESAGFADQEQQTGAMQQTGLRIKRIRFGNDRSSLYMKIETSKRITSERVVIDFSSPERITVEIGKGLIVRYGESKEGATVSLRYLKGENVEIKIDTGRVISGEATFSVSIYDADVLLDSLPHEGLAKFKIFQ